MRPSKNYRLLKLKKPFSYGAISGCFLFFCWLGILIFNPWQELYAKDFGIEGHVFSIIEEDILKVIKHKLAKVDLDELNKKMQERTRGYVERPSVVKGIANAEKTKEFSYDPTYELAEDIKDNQEKLIYKAGTKINPLESIPLREALIFIDGDDKSQVNLALKLRQKYNNKAKIILVKGSPLQLQRNHKKDKIWFYFDQAGFITQKLGITEVPALVTQDGLKLKIQLIGENESKIILESNIEEESKKTKATARNSITSMEVR